jgi:hypothetical protein
MKTKNVQVPETFIVDVYKLISLLEDYELDETTKSILESLERQIEAKMERMEARNQYTVSLNHKNGVIHQ